MVSVVNIFTIGATRIPHRVHGFDPADSWCWRAEVEGEGCAQQAEKELCARDAGRSRATVLIWLLNADCCISALARSVLASLALALHAATAGPRHGSCQTLTTLTLTQRSLFPQLCVSSMRFTCSGPAFYTWRLLPLICLKLLAGVCASYETGLLPLFAYVTLLLLLPLSYFLGAVAFPRRIHVLPKLFTCWLIVCRCFRGLCFGFIGAIFACQDEDIGRPVLKSYPPPKDGSSAAKKVKFWGGNIVVSAALKFRRNFQAEIAVILFGRKNCPANLNSREQQAIPDD